MNRGYEVRLMLSRGVPRRRGDEPNFEWLVFLGEGRSPQARG